MKSMKILPVKSLKMLPLLAAVMAAHGAYGVIDLRAAYLNANTINDSKAVLTNNVSGGIKGMHYIPDEGFEPWYVIDGITDNSSGDKRWLGKIIPGSTDTNETTFIQFNIPSAMGADGRKVTGYRLHRTLTPYNVHVERAPTAWKLLGVTKDGETVTIDEKTIADNIVWTSGNSIDVTSKTFTVNDDRKFVNLIWIPTASKVTQNGYNQIWNVGLNELEIFIDEDVEDPIPGVNLAQWMKDHNYKAQDYVTGGTPNVNYRQSNPPQLVFDRNYFGGVSANYWLGSIDKKDPSKTAFISVRVPEELQGGVRPTGYRVRRSPKISGTDDAAPTTWEFYGITVGGETNLLSEVKKIRWENYSTMSVLHYGETALENPENKKFAEFLWIPRESPFSNKTLDGLKINIFDIDSKIVNIYELEIFFDPNEPLSGKNLVREIKNAGLTLNDYISGVDYGGAYDYKRAFDGVTSSINFDNTRWLGRIINDEQTTARIEINVPSQLYPDGAPLSYYRIHRMTHATDAVSRAPLTWEMYGIKKNGKKILISEVVDSDPAKWWHVPFCSGCNEEVTGASDVQGNDPQYVTVTNMLPAAEANFVKFIWIPRSTPKSLVDPDPAALDVGISELEIFVGDPLFPVGTTIIVR